MSLGNCAHCRRKAIHSAGFALLQLPIATQKKGAKRALDGSTDFA